MVAVRSLFPLVLLSLAAINAAAQKSRVDSVVDMQEFIRDWQISRQFTLDVASAMPAEDYGFKPRAEEMTFGEQMVHIAMFDVYRSHEITAIRSPFAIGKAPAPDKANVLKVLAQPFDPVVWKGRNDPDGSGDDHEYGCAHGASSGAGAMCILGRRQSSRRTHRF